MGGGGQVGVEHPRYPNVFALGDASSLPTSKTAAAVRKQAPVLAEDLSAAMQSKPLPACHDSYTCCPLTIAEFAYNGKLALSFPLAGALLHVASQSAPVALPPSPSPQEGCSIYRQALNFFSTARSSISRAVRTPPE